MEAKTVLGSAAILAALGVAGYAVYEFTKPPPRQDRNSSGGGGYVDDGRRNPPPSDSGSGGGGSKSAWQRMSDAERILVMIQLASTAASEADAIRKIMKDWGLSRQEAEEKVKDPQVQSVLANPYADKGLGIDVGGGAFGPY